MWKDSQIKCYLFKVNNRNSRKSCEICSELTTETSERCQWRPFGIFIGNFEHIAHVSSVSVVDFEKIGVSLVVKY